MKMVPRAKMAALMGTVSAFKPPRTTRPSAKAEAEVLLDAGAILSLSFFALVPRRAGSGVSAGLLTVGGPEVQK